MIKRNIFPILLGWLIVFPATNWTTDLKPWFRNDSEVVLRTKLLYQNYDSIATPHHSFKQSDKGAFWSLSAEYPFRRYCGEFEATTAYTFKQKGGRWDNFRFTGRFAWLNEMYGDSLSLVTGLTFTQPFSRALHDISSFHHGHFEGELHLSLGQQYGFQDIDDYRFRWWSIFSAGQADEGNNFYKVDLAGEYKYHNSHFRGFMHTLMGAGNVNLTRKRIKHFAGYGCIKHRSIDLGFRYELLMGQWGTLAIQFARRVFAYNFPENANLLLLEYRLALGKEFVFVY